MIKHFHNFLPYQPDIAGVNPFRHRIVIAVLFHNVVNYFIHSSHHIDILLQLFFIAGSNRPAIMEHQDVILANDNLVTGQRNNGSDTGSQHLNVRRNFMLAFADGIHQLETGKYIAAGGINYQLYILLRIGNLVNDCTQVEYIARNFTSHSSVSSSSSGSYLYICSCVSIALAA